MKHCAVMFDPAIAEEPVEATSFVQTGQSDDNGTPIRRAMKDILLIGKYSHPSAGWELDVTVDMLDDLARTAQGMLASGLDIEATQDHSRSADDVLGRITDVWSEGDRLMALFEFRGEEAIKTSERVQRVSIEIEPNMVDGMGRKWGQAITAVSLVQQPVVPGQTDFVTLSRNNGIDKACPVMLFSKHPSNHSGANEMNKTLTAIRQILSLADDVELPEGDEALAASLLEFGAKRKAERDDADGKVKTKIAALEEELAEAKASSKKKASLDAETTEVMEARSETITQGIEGLIGKTIEVTPAVAEKLCASLIPADDDGKVKMLSRRGTDEEKIDPASKQVLATLKDVATESPIAGKSKTGVQIAMGRKAAGAAGGDESFDQECQDDMSAMIS